MLFGPVQIILFASNVVSFMFWILSSHAEQQKAVQAAMDQQKLPQTMES